MPNNVRMSSVVGVTALAALASLVVAQLGGGSIVDLPRTELAEPSPMAESAKRPDRGHIVIIEAYYELVAESSKPKKPIKVARVNGRDVEMVAFGEQDGWQQYRYAQPLERPLEIAELLLMPGDDRRTFCRIWADGTKVDVTPKFNFGMAECQHPSARRG